MLKWSVGGGLLAALGLCAACCLLPMMLIGLGAGGAWISSFDSLAPYKWLFIAATVALLAYGFYAAYWKPKRSCAAGVSCPTCGSPRSLRILLWIATVIAIAVPHSSSSSEGSVARDNVQFSRRFLDLFD